MKYLILILLLMGCSSKCPQINRSNELIYGVAVKITEGFYSGQTGVLTDTGTGYFRQNGEACGGMPVYRIKLKDSTFIDVDQNELEVIK